MKFMFALLFLASPLIAQIGGGPLNGGGGGGTGCITTGSGLQKGDGAGGCTPAAAGTDYVIPSGTVANATTAANATAINGLAVPVSAPLLGTNALGQTILVGGANPYCAGSACASQTNYLFATASSLSLSASATASDTSFTVTSTTGFPSSGCGYVALSGFAESFCWSSIDATHLLGLTRGFYGTTASAKTVGAIIWGYMETSARVSTIAPVYNISNASTIAYGTASVQTAYGAFFSLPSRFGSDVGIDGNLTLAGTIATSNSSSLSTWKLNSGTGRMDVRQQNTTCYVVSSASLTAPYDSIQKAVTACVANGGGRVIVPKAITPTDTISAVTGGAISVPVIDENTLPSSSYTWNGTNYILSTAGSISGTAGNVAIFNPAGNGLADSGQSLPTFDNTDATLVDVFDLHEGSGTTLTGIINGTVCNITGSASTDPAWVGKTLLAGNTNTGYISCPTITTPVTFQVVSSVNAAAATSTGGRVFAGLGSVPTGGSSFWLAGDQTVVNTLGAEIFNYHGASALKALALLGDQVQVLTFSGGTTNTWAYVNTQQLTTIVGATSLGSVTMPTGAPFAVFGSQGTSCTTLGTCAMKNGTLLGFAVYSTQPTSQTNMTALINKNALAWNNVVTNKGFQIGSFVNNYTSATVRILCGITSIEAGVNSNQPPCTTANTGLSSATYIPLIPAIGGSTMAAWIATGLQPYQKYFDNSSGRIYGYMGSAATNDLCQSGSSFTLAVAWQNVLAGVRTLKKLGANQVFLGTMLSRTGNGAGVNSGSTCDSLKNQYNALVRASTSAASYNLIDIAANPVLGADGAAANTTNFPDGVHPSAALQTGTYGPTFARAILSADGTTATSPGVYTSATQALTSADNFTTAAVTAAATWSLPECLGLTGYVYRVQNPTAFTITMAGINSEAISGGTLVAPGATGYFKVVLTSASTGGCSWQSTYTYRAVPTNSLGTAIPSASTIAPTASVTHVTGTSSISTITPPYAGFVGSLTLIADGAWTTVTGGNIAAAMTAVAGVQYTFTYDGTLWYAK
jgi:hypothetical protein